MSEHDSDVHSSTNGSDSDDSPAESIHSYVRSRPPRGARVTFAPPYLDLGPSSTTHRAPRRTVTDRPRSPPRYAYRSSPRERAPEDRTFPTWGSLEDLSSPRFDSNGRTVAVESGRKPYASSGPDYHERYPDEDNTSPHRFNSREPGIRVSSGPYIYANDSDLSASDSSESFRRRSSPIHQRIYSRTRDRSLAANPSARFGDFIYDSDDEGLKIHHVINVHPSRSVTNSENQEQKWLGNRVFTHQSSLNQDEKTLPETYRIVQSRLVPRSEDHPHDQAILTYEDKAAADKTEIRWVYVCSHTSLNFVYTRKVLPTEHQAVTFKAIT